MLGYGHARDARVCSAPDRAPDRSDTGCCRDPSPAGAGHAAGRGLESSRRLGRSQVGRRWQEYGRARVQTPPEPRPPDILKPRPVIPEPRERDDTGHPRPSGYDVDAECQVVPHGERAMTVPTGSPDPVDDRSAWSVEPTHALVWDGLEGLCGGPESLPWCGECFTDRRRAQACPWGALSGVVVKPPGDGPEHWG